MKNARTRERRPRARGSLAARGLAAALSFPARFGRALLGHAWAIGLLRLLIVAELCLLGVGVVRRLETSYEVADQVARMQLAIVEAQEMGLANRQKSALDIAASAGASDAADEPSGDAPSLRPRDISSIISDMTGDADAASDMLADSPVADAAAEPDPTAETAEEVDVYIRRGVAAMTAGDMRQCILSLEQARSLAPGHPALLYYYGLAYDKLLNPAKAKEFYDQIFRMRDRAGKYFQRASRRLAYGMEQPSAMRGKLAFGPYKVQRSSDPEKGEKVSILLPILLAPGEEIRSDDVYIRVQVFELVNGRKVDFSRAQPKYSWANETQTWETWQEDLIVTYEAPVPTPEELSSAGEVKYYGFTAVLAYKGEPLDLISTPAALILHEQQLSSPRRGGSPGLLPDDGLSPYAEEAIPYSDAFEDTTPDYL